MSRAHHLGPGPVPRRPQALLFVSYHLAAPLRYLLERARGRSRHDLVQMIESNLSFGDLSYVHFCHGAFLRRSPPRRPTVRAWLRWLDHRLHAAVEPRTFRRVRRIVVPSEGLAQELRQEYPITAGKLSVISNAVDRQRMEQPAGFDRHAWRSSLGLRDGDIAVVFTALGHFERKGLRCSSRRCARSTTASSSSSSEASPALSRHTSRTRPGWTWTAR